MSGSMVLVPHTAVVLSAGTGAKTLFTGAARLRRVFVSAALVGTLTITGFKDEAGTNASVVLPIGFVGTMDLDDSLAVNGNFTAQKSSASDDAKVVITYAPE